MSFRTTALTVLAAAVPIVTAAGGGDDGPSPADLLNNDISFWLGWLWIALLFAFFVYQVVLHLVHYVRHIACLYNDSQRYFAKPNAWYGAFKTHLLDAPLFRTRHHREFKLSAALNLSTLPSRLQTIVLVGYFGTNVAFCVLRIDYSQPFDSVARVLRNRFGVLSVMNMIPLFVLAGRNNPFIKACGISFDTMNLLHRWLGRISVLEAVGHTLAWMIPKVKTGGWAAVAKSLGGSEFLLTGTIATCAFLGLMFLSPSVLRHAFYETFLHIHIALAAVGVATVWFHCKDMERLNLVWAVVAIWACERGLRFFSLIYRNVGAGGTKITVEALPGDALRVDMHIARPWKFRAGQHVYLTVPSVGLWTNHPFSLAWSENDGEIDMSSEKGLPSSSQDVLSTGKTSMSLIIRRRTGFTDTLFKKAENSTNGTFTTTAFVEGPYGGESLNSYGTVMLWAAGIGITHQVPFVRQLVAAYANGATATRRLTLVWIIQSPEHLEWIRPWMTTILNMPRRREILKILLFVTRPRSTKEIHSPSSSVQMFPGKPNVQALIDQEMQEALGAACVTVCGTGALADDLRRAVRIRQHAWNVDFKEESFSW